MLSKQGATYFKYNGPDTDIKAAPGEVQQARIETSNVGSAESAVRLVTVMWQFEMLQKAIGIGTDMNRQALEEVARSGQYLKGRTSRPEPIQCSERNECSTLTVDSIANNLANANTTGYKMRRTQFQDLMYESMIPTGSAAGTQTLYPTGLQVGLGVRPASNEIVFTQGNAVQTDNPLDLTIQGKGFFQVLQPDGTTAYTRDGRCIWMLKAISSLP